MIVRDNRVDFLRALAIAIVVFGHSIIIYSSSWGIYKSQLHSPFLDTVKSVINIIQMPLFFALSGYLFFLTGKSKKRLRTILADKTVRIIVPYLIIAFFWLLPIRFAVNYPGYSKSTLLDVVFHKILLGEDNGHLWYLPALFFNFLAWHIIVKAFNLYAGSVVKSIIIFGAAAIAYFVVSHFRVGSFLKEAIHYSEWFFLGFSLNQHQSYISRLRESFAAKIIFISILLGLCYCIIVSSGYFLTAGLTIIAGAVFVIIAFAVCPSRKNKFIDYLSVNSFGIYLFHSPLVYITYSELPSIPVPIMVALNFFGFGVIALALTVGCRKFCIPFVIGESK